MKNDAGAMTDEALLRACRPLPWESRLESAGCGFALAAGLLAAYGTYRLVGGAGWLLIAIAFFAAGITAGIKVTSLTDRRARREQAELRRRHTPPPLDEALKRAEEELERQDAPDWELLLHGRALPHGGTVGVRVVLWQADPPGGRISARRASDVDFRRDSPFTGERGERALDAQECAGLLALLPDLLTAGTDPIQNVVIDGFPCELAAVRRRPRLVFKRDCNLAGIPESHAAHPVPMLMRRMMELSEGMTKQPLVFGWCDPHGDVGIGEA